MKKLFNRIMDGFARLARVSIMGCGLAVSTAASAATFNGTGTGNIPDGSGSCGGPGAPLVISFSVNGMGAPLTDIRVTMNFIPQHTFAGDVLAVLKAPGGSPSATLFGRIGATSGLSFGSGRHLSGIYTFVDPVISTANIWSAEAAVVAPSGVIPGGTYATTGSGPVATPPAPTTPLLSVFTSLTGAQVNGTWTLELTDRCASDQGGISAASLTLDSLPPPPTQFTTAPSVVDFGSMRVGDVAFRSFGIVAPAANGLAVEVPAGNCTIVGPDAGMFAKLFNAVAVQPGQTEVLAVAFRPTSAGSKTAILNCTGLLPSGVTPATLNVALTGVGGAPPAPANCYDVDGDGIMNPLVDGLFIARLQLGLTLPAAANGIIFSAPRNTPLKVAAFLIQACGYPLAP